MPYRIHQSRKADDHTVHLVHHEEFKNEIPNLDELLALHREHGGSIIQYDRILAIVVFTRRTAVYEWVPNRVSRYQTGLKHALWCALFGWWSWIGLIITGILIFNNLLGGLDFTRFLTTPPPLPGATEDSALRELQATERKRQHLLFGCLLLVLLMYFLNRWHER